MKFKMIKRVFLIFVVSMIALLCGACKEEPTTSAVKKTVITYCNWNFGTEEANNITRRRVEAFNKQSSTIRIEMVLPLDGTSYDDFLATLAAGGSLPDVFMVNSVPTAVINQWALDITDVATLDEEWNDIPVSLRNSITYNNQIYGVPAGQYYMGFFANLDLIDNYLTGGETAAEKFETGEFTTDEWIEVVKQMRDINKTDGTGVIGMSAVGDMINWLPATLDETGKTKHFVWNGKSFDFTSDILIEALQKISDLGDPSKQYVFSSVPAVVGEGEEAIDNRMQIFGSGDAASVFKNGQMGFIQEGSWANTFDDTDFECTFISYPDARVMATTDYMCISKSTANKEAAYEVAKYMTFGSQGINDLFKIIDDNPDANLSLTGIPLNTKKDISDKWFSYIKMKGFKETFEKAANGEIEVIVEGNKYIPGFLKARFTFQTGLSFEGVREGQLLTIGDFIWDVCGGEISINDYIANMTQALADRINQEVKTDFDKMGIPFE